MSNIDAFFRMMYVNFGGTDFASVVMKLLVATVFSGAIELERNIHKQNAGLRTYILVCVGACLAMMTNEFTLQYLNPNSDPARLGAQVITGVGFLGAGTIVLAGRQVIGLTTILIFLSFELLPYIERVADANARRVFYHIELTDATKYMEYRTYVEDGRIEVQKSSVSKTRPLIEGGISFRLMLRRPADMSIEALTEYLEQYPLAYLVEEL